MAVDPSKWRRIGSDYPTPEWKQLQDSGGPSLSTAVETFLVVFKDLKFNQPDYLYRSKLVLQPKFAQGAGYSDLESKAVWLRPSSEPKEITLDYPLALLQDGSIFRLFEFRRHNYYGRRYLNNDGPWGFDLYESLTSVNLQNLPPPPERPPEEPEWRWVPPNFD